MEPILEIKNLTKYYKDVLGIKDLSLTLYEKETFGLIGPNGAGKSTTIRVIMNLINKTNGEVFFKGKKLDKNSIELKKEIGYLPSEISLYDDLTVGEIFDYHEVFFDKKIHKRRKELVKKLKIDESKKIEELSLGNLKKIGIVLAFMHEPKLLILDEPTSGLDPIMQQIFYDLLEEENKKGTTILYSTHILNEVPKVCNKVGIIKNGKLLKIESIKELKDKSLTFVTITSQEIEKIKRDLNPELIFENDEIIKFKNTQTPNELIKTLSKYNIQKILIEEATLEEMFLHYYE